MSTQTLPLPLTRQISYAIGQLGWSILINIIGFHQVFFYLPPNGEGLPELIVKVAFFGISTIGVVSALGRLWDGVTDPIIANMSDKWSSKWGRRIPFLATGGLPAAVFCLLIFTPPDRGITVANLVWMTAALLLFYLFLTVYVTPFFALIPELGHTPNERLNLSTFISVTYALGIMVAAQVPLIAEKLVAAVPTLDKVGAYQWAIGILCGIAAICMYFPVFAIDEKKYTQSEPSAVPFKEALLMTFKNKDFLFFAISDFNYFLSLTILTTGLSYYITVLLFQEASLVSEILPVMLFSSFLPRVIQAYLIVVVAGIPMAILGILPNAILADIAELDALKTGSRREGLFYAARTLMQKLGQTIGVLIFSSLLLVGGGINKVEKTDSVTGKKVLDREKSNLIGVQITGPVAAGFCLLAIVMFSRYKEKETLEEIERITRK